MADVELTVKQVAADLRTSERTVRRWLTEGRLVGRRVDRGKNLGKAWRIDADSVRRVAADVSRGQTSAAKASGHAAATVAADQAEALAGEVRSLREEGAEYRRVIELQAQAIGNLSGRVNELADQVAQLRRLLPPAPEEVTSRPSWWRRLWGRGGGK